MATQKAENINNAFGKTFACVSLSAFYFAMLAWPFGLTETGYMTSRALLAGAIMFAISIPAWVVNIKREFFSAETEVAQAAEVKAPVIPVIGELATNSK